MDGKNNNLLSLARYESFDAETSTNSNGYTELELALLYLLENQSDLPVELIKKLAIDYIHNSALIRKELKILWEKFESFNKK